MSRIRTPLAFTAVGVLAISVVGALVADADGIASFASAVGPSGSKLSVPLPVLLVEVGGALGPPSRTSPPSAMRAESRPCWPRC